jgi:hypothetical protein
MQHLLGRALGDKLSDAYIPPLSGVGSNQELFIVIGSNETIIAKLDTTEVDLETFENIGLISDDVMRLFVEHCRKRSCNVRELTEIDWKTYSHMAL